MAPAKQRHIASDIRARVVGDMRWALMHPGLSHLRNLFLTAAALLMMGALPGEAIEFPLSL